MTAATAPMSEHIGELRNRVIKCAVAVLIGSIIGYAINEWVLELLIAPYAEAVDDASLVFFRPGEGFSVVMKVSLWTGTVLASPIILYQTWRFVSPALTRREKKWAIPVTVVFVALFLAGIAVGYLALRQGLVFLLEFGGDSLDPLIGADDYLKFAMRFLLAFGLSFEFPIFLFVLAAFGVVSSKWLASGRRWAVIVILIAAALITPTGDPLTLLMLSVPLYLMYEITIVLIKLILKK